MSPKELNPPENGSAVFMRGYSRGYQAGLKRGRKESAGAVIRSPLARIEHETGDGYTCVACGIQRPRNWFVYEIERDGKWVTPCCARCAREHKSRGPFPQYAGLWSHGGKES